MVVAEGIGYKGDHKTGASRRPVRVGRYKWGKEQEKTTSFILNENAIIKHNTEHATLTLVT